MSEQLQTPIDERTEYQKAIDMSWRVEGIEEILKAKGDAELADKVANALQIAMTLDPEDEESARAVQSFLWEAIQASDNYDSGNRKFEVPPSEAA